MEAYCMKCKTKREIKDPVAGFNARSSAVTTGTCSVCGTKLFRMGKTEAHEGLIPPPKPEKVEVREGKLIPVPVHLRDKHYAGAEKLGHGVGYQYAHDHPTGFVAQDYLGVARRFYEPSERGWEGACKERINAFRAILDDCRRIDPKQ